MTYPDSKTADNVTRIKELVVERNNLKVEVLRLKAEVERLGMRQDELLIEIDNLTEKEWPIGQLGKS